MTIIGTPGGSLENADWLGAGKKAQASAGQSGEKRTAAITDAFVRKTNGAVLHDLRIPIQGYRANIDHVLVSGQNITIVDTKVWEGGFYWTLGKVTRNGFKKVPHADKRTLPAAVRGITDYLNGQNIKFRIRPSLLVVWSSRPINSLFYRPAESRFIPGNTFRQNIGKLVGRKPADQSIVQALGKLTY